MPQPRRLALLLALATLALYLPVAWFDFCVYDDGLYVTENPTVQNGVTLAGVKWAFTTFAASNWHPLTWLSHMLDCGVFGLNPAGPHLVNALIHAANAALLLILLFRLTQKIWPAAFIAALFAWHPLHVESVAWISERKDVLSTFFALLAFIAYARFAQEPATRSKDSGATSGALLLAPCAKFYWLALFCFALGLLAKPMLVTLPCVLLLLDCWPLNRFSLSDFRFQIFGKLFAEKLPFFLLAAGASLVTFIAQSQRGSAAVDSLAVIPLHYRLKSVPVAYAEYLGKTFWPAKLAFFYPLPDKISAAQVAVAVTVLICVSLAALWLRRTRPYLLTGWLWFIGMLVPVIGLVQVGGAQIADRYSYLPAVGIFIIVTLVALDVAARWKIPGKILGIAAVAILLALAVTAEKQIWHWQNSETLFRHALAVATDNDVARNNLGITLERQGRLTEAVEQYRAAIAIEPTRFHGHHNLANALDQQGQHAAALAEHRAAARLSPDTQFLHNRLGMALKSAGLTEAAIREFYEAARVDPQYPWSHLELAKIFLAQGRDTEALAELRAAVRLAPDNVDILIYTAQVLATAQNSDLRDGAAAFALGAKANLLTGGRRPEVIDVLGMACAEMGKFAEAQAAAQQALDVADALKIKDVAPIRQRLELYKSQQPCRENFRATNAPTKN